jgi:hypothetical protein
MNQRGFISPMLVMGVGLVLMGVAVGIQTKRLEAEIKDHADFVATVRENGKTAQKLSDMQRDKDIARKEKADADHKKSIAGYLATIKRLRDDSAARSFVSAPAPGASRPDIACYPRQRLDGEIRESVGEITAVLADLGAAAVELNTAKAWAK